METPAIPLPKDAREREILDTLVGIRDHLLLLKRDRTKYIRSQDVMLVYDQVVEQVKQLNEIRKESGEKGENRCKLASPLTRAKRLTNFPSVPSQWTRSSRAASSSSPSSS